MGLLTNDQSASQGPVDLRTKATDRGPFPTGQGLEQYFQKYGGEHVPQPPQGDHSPSEKIWGSGNAASVSDQGEPSASQDDMINPHYSQQGGSITPVPQAGMPGEGTKLNAAGPDSDPENQDDADYDSTEDQNSI